MPERRPSNADVERALATLAHDVDTPAAPLFGDRVTSRLLADRAAAVSPPLPRRALWTPRTRLVLATLAVLALLALAATTRLVIGAVEIRVVPTPSSSPSTATGAPLVPGDLGAQIALTDLDEAVGFHVAIPEGRPPDAAYVSTSRNGAAILAWRPDDRSPRLPGTPWGLILVELPEPSDELLVKEVNAFDDTDEITLDGDRAFWIHAPHDLLVITDAGDTRFHIDGNVLVWERDGITFRLETPLGLEAARAVAVSVS
jgi:hypothetical protein